MDAESAPLRQVRLMRCWRACIMLYLCVVFMGTPAPCMPSCRGAQPAPAGEHANAVGYVCRTVIMAMLVACMQTRGPGSRVPCNITLRERIRRSGTQREFPVVEMKTHRSRQAGYTSRARDTGSLGQRSDDAALSSEDTSSEIHVWIDALCDKSCHDPRALSECHVLMNATS